MPRERLLRDHLRANIQVFDANTGEKLGHLLDISLGGLGVAGSGDKPAEGEGRLSLRFPFKVRERRELTLPVVCRWVEHTEGHHWHAGYHIIRVEDADVPVLEHLMTWHTDPA